MALDRWELLRALGAVAADPAAARELGLLPAGPAEHAEVFAFNCPPYASVYLGAGNGQLATQLATQLRALRAAAGAAASPEPDHLTELLGLYARLGQAGEDGTRRVLFREHLWPWLPAYLGAVIRPSSRSSRSACSTVSRPTA